MTFQVLFDGEHVGDYATAETLEMEDGDQLDVMFRQTGMIGIFVAPGEFVPSTRNNHHWSTAQSLPGFALLDQAGGTAETITSAMQPPADMVRALALSVSPNAVFSAADDVTVGVAPILSADMCRQLISMVSSAWSKALEALPQNLRTKHYIFRTEDGGDDGVASQQNENVAGILGGSCTTDFRFVLTANELESVIGTCALATIRAAVATSCSSSEPAFCLRRTAATGRMIPFHIDCKKDATTPSSSSSSSSSGGGSRRTLQVPLSADDECTGGRLIFAGSDGKVLEVERVRGAILAHGDCVVHGVTRLLRGVRYGLYALSD